MPCTGNTTPECLAILDKLEPYQLALTVKSDESLQNVLRQ